jgi:hypothetical protein
VDTSFIRQHPPLFRWAPQNLATAAMLLRDYLEAATSEERQVRQQLKALLEAAAANKQSASRRGNGRRTTGELCPLRTARTHLPGGSEATGAEPEPGDRQSIVISGQTATPGTPSKLAGGPQALTTTAMATTAITVTSTTRADT